MKLASYLDESGRHFVLNAPINGYNKYTRFVWIDLLEMEGIHTFISYRRSIINNKINWQDIDKQYFTNECMKYFDRIIKLIAFI